MPVTINPIAEENRSPDLCDTNEDTTSGKKLCQNKEATMPVASDPAAAENSEETSTGKLKMTNPKNVRRILNTGAFKFTSKHVNVNSIEEYKANLYKRKSTGDRQRVEEFLENGENSVTLPGKKLCTKENYEANNCFEQNYF